MAAGKRARLALRSGYPRLAQALHERNPQKARIVLESLRPHFERADRRTLEHCELALGVLEREEAWAFGATPPGFPKFGG